MIVFKIVILRILLLLLHKLSASIPNLYQLRLRSTMIFKAGANKVYLFIQAGTTHDLVVDIDD